MRRTRAYQAPFDTGVFIRGNSRTVQVTSNHFPATCSDGVSGAVFAGLEQGAEWTSLRTRRSSTIDVQVPPDGADYESSIPYHRRHRALLGAASLIISARRCRPPVARGCAT
jgi:hypothetical protein